MNFIWGNNLKCLRQLMDLELAVTFEKKKKKKEKILVSL